MFCNQILYHDIFRTAVHADTVGEAGQLPPDRFRTLSLRQAEVEHGAIHQRPLKRVQFLRLLQFAAFAFGMLFHPLLFPVEEQKKRHTIDSPGSLMFIRYKPGETCRASFDVIRAAPVRVLKEPSSSPGPGGLPRRDLFFNIFFRRG